MRLVENPFTRQCGKQKGLRASSSFALLLVALKCRRGSEGVKEVLPNEGTKEGSLIVGREDGS